jgi:uncharacterized protein (DUF885 family)
MSLAAESARLRELRAQRAELARFVASSPDKESALRARSLMAAVDTDIFGIEVMKPLTRNPMTYAGAVDVSIYAKRDFAPKAERLASAVKVLEGVPGVVAAAKAQLDRAVPRVFVETAVTMAKGQADFIAGDLVAGFDDVADAGAKARLRAAADAAAAAMREYAAWLTAERLPGSTSDFALGRDNFARILRQSELIAQTPEEVLAIGMKELERQKAAFIAAAREIDPSRPAAEVWTAVQNDHPTPESLLPDTRSHLAEIKRFFVDRDLIRYPTNEEVIVDETPGFLRATSFASMDMPGPFEKKATESYYYVTPPETSWDKARIDEWLTAFNYATTDIVSVHEAYPGHFVQGLHLKASPVRGAWQFIGSYAFIEGWAHYTEQLAIDEGFPPASLRKDDKTVARYRMAQASEALLRCCRLVAAVRMHCQGMTLDEATKFFVDNAFYTQAPARSEAERGSYDPGYCLYTVGKLQFFTLREDWKKQEGSAFSLKRFHDEALRHGMPQLRLLRERMLRDASGWDRTIGG